MSATATVALSIKQPWAVFGGGVLPNHTTLYYIDRHFATP